MACGCGSQCSCTVAAGTGVTVTGSGANGDPFVISSIETVFAALSAGNTITITAGGSDGHAPNLDVNISPNAGNAIENAGNGLFVGPNALAAAVFPIGMSIEITHDGALPAGFLDEDGAELNVDDYPQLASKYGATGIGDGLWDTHPQFGAPGAGKFRTPDSQSRAVYNRGTGFAVGDDDAVALASRTPNHVHTGPSHQHSVPGLGITAEAPGTGIANNDGEANSHHTGYIIREAGRTKLVGGTDGIASSDLAPTGAASADAFTKLQHDHTVASHSHGGSTAGGTSGFAGTGNTGNKSPGHIIYRRAVFAGI